MISPLISFKLTKIDDIHKDGLAFMQNSVMYVMYYKSYWLVLTTWLEPGFNQSLFLISSLYDIQSLEQNIQWYEYESPR